MRSIDIKIVSPLKSSKFGPSKALRQIRCLKLIEIAQARYLLTIPSGTPIEALEVAQRDLFSNPELQKNKREKPVLYELLNLIGHHSLLGCHQKFVLSNPRRRRMLGSESGFYGDFFSA